MSGAPPRQIGPREARIKELWDKVWHEHSQGGVFEPYIAIAEADLANFAASLPQNDIAAANDLIGAQNLHLFQSRYFGAHVDRLEGFRSQLDRLVEWTYDQMTAFNLHSVRSLTTANGGVVLAALAYIQAQKTVPVGFLWVILFGATGYVLTLLGSHAVTLFSSKPLQILSELRLPRLSAQMRETKLQDLKKSTRWFIWGSRPLFYLSGICLVAALWIGVDTLLTTRALAQSVQLQPPFQSKTAIQGNAVSNSQQSSGSNNLSSRPSTP